MSPNWDISEFRENIEVRSSKTSAFNSNDPFVLSFFEVANNCFALDTEISSQPLLTGKA